MTSRPRLRASIAAASPLPPPPITITSALVRFSVPLVGNLVHLLQYPAVRLLVIAIQTLLFGSLMLIEAAQIRLRKRPETISPILEDGGAYVSRAG